MISLVRLFSILLLFIFSASSKLIYSEKSSANDISLPSDYAIIDIYRGTYDENMTISLKKSTTKTNKELFGEFIYLDENKVAMIILDDVNPDFSFLVAQVHVHIDPVEIYKPDKEPRVMGQNVGLYIDIKNDRHAFLISNWQRPGRALYVSIHGYGPNDPIPGGCNMESTIPTPPSTDIQLKSNYYYVDIAPPMAPSDPKCLKNDVAITFYMLYLPEFDYTADVYFDGIRRMMSYKNITDNGVVVPFIFWNTRRMMSLYFGTGTVFAAIARTAGGYSIYVPAQTYGCADISEPYCTYLGEFRIRMFALSLIFVSLLICFTGHRYVQTEMMVEGFIASAVIVYIVLSITTDMLRHINLLISLICGFIFAVTWSLTWLVWGSPITIVLISALNCGFMASSIIYYALPSPIPYLEVDFNFWSLFILVLLLVAMAILSAAKYGNILSCAFLGSYGFVVAIDVLIGSNFKFILLNIIRRATVPNFNKAVLLPPFQTYEKNMIAVWVLVALAGMAVQYWTTRGRPSFPMISPRLTVRQVIRRVMYGTYNQRVIARSAAPPPHADERTPLLA